MSSDSPAPSALPLPGELTITPIPSKANVIATVVRTPMRSRSTTKPSSAANTGDTAWIDSTCATEAWFNAPMKDDTPKQTTNATPAPPIERHASGTRPRPATITYAAIDRAANRARPPIWVGRGTDESWRCSTPAVDHTTAASATGS
jgi:hypothetical protein